MLIKRDVLERIRSGEITLQFRRWTRRTVKPGGTLKTKVGILRIGAITPIAPEEVSAADAQRAGFAGVADFLAWLDTMKPGELDRIEVAYGGEDPREALGRDGCPDAAALAGIEAALEDIDAREGAGWSGKVLGLIAAQEGLAAADLAARIGQDREGLKAGVRKLKDLGLTESLEVGYRLSPRGAAVLGHLERSQGLAFSPPDDKSRP